ncbi:MAG: ferrous iron transport protein A [Opitutales bacterium]|nr:ferrous iron transport protein A [Opitutales bacterium]
MEKLLSEFSPNEIGQVVKILGEGRLRRRIFDMGITPDTEILMRKSAPLGDPIEVSLRGYELSLRKAEASLIKMRVEK